MDLEVIMQKITADASGYIREFERINEAQRKAVQNFNTVRTALNNIGADAQIGAVGVNRIATAVSGLGQAARSGVTDLDSLVKKQDELANKGGKGFGRWWLAGAAAHIGSQLGPLGQIGGDIAAGGLVGGPAGAGLGALAGTLQAGITLFNELKAIGQQAFQTITSFAEMAARSLAGLVADTIKTGTEFEKMRTVLQSVSGSKDVGTTLFNDIKNLSGFLPYTVESLANASEHLLSMGTRAQDLIPTLTSLGTIVHGDEQKLHALSLAINEVANEGVLDFRRLRQFASVGIGIEDISRSLGKSSAEVSAMLHSHQLGYNELATTINYAMGPLGRFGTLNQNVLEKTFGAWQQFRNQLRIIQGDIGEGILNRTGASGVLQNMTSWLSANRDRIEAVLLTVWDRIQTAATVAFQVIQNGWDAVVNRFGGGGKSFEDLIPSAERVAEVMREILNAIRSIVNALMSAVQLYVKMEMLSLSIKVSMLEVANIAIQSTTVDNIVKSFHDLQNVLADISKGDWFGNLKSGLDTLTGGAAFGGKELYPTGKLVGFDATGQNRQEGQVPKPEMENEVRGHVDIIRSQQDQADRIRFALENGAWDEQQAKILTQLEKSIEGHKKSIQRIRDTGGYEAPGVIPRLEEKAAAAQEEAAKIPEAYLKGLTIDPNRIQGQTQKMLNSIYETMDKGFTPLQEYQKAQKQTKEIFDKLIPDNIKDITFTGPLREGALRDQAFAEPHFIGPLFEGQRRLADDEARMTPELRHALNEGEFKRFETLASKYKSPAQSLTGAFYAGSGEAQDVINKARLEQAGSMQDQIRQVMTDALLEEKEHTRLLQEFIDFQRNELLPALPQGGGG